MADTSRASGVEEDLSAGDADQASAPGNTPVGGGGLTGLSGGDIAVEAASYGPADGAPAEEVAGEDESDRASSPPVVPIR